MKALLFPGQGSQIVGMGSDFFNKYNFDELVQFFYNLGFNCTSLDLEGLISGKLNR